MPVQSGGVIYFAFIAAVFFLYWSCSRARWARLSAVLLANSLFCATFGVIYAGLLPVCSAVDYFIGRGLMRSNGAATRRALLAISIVLNLALLLGARQIGRFLGGSWIWVMPLGLSFYAFQSLTYTIDLYRRDGECARSLLSYLSATGFFPVLQAGPINRLTELVKQFEAPAALSRIDGGRAFFLIGLGLVKKTLIADYLSENFVTRVFDTPNLYSGAETLIAVYAYALQLYFDFSGYTDIARGAGLLLGIRLPINFDRPYLSSNLVEFWRRWHISFSNWLRDYLYFALPGARSKVMPYVNLVITMLLGGLWHGISWTFAIWGLLHGVALAATRWRMSRRSRIRSTPSRLGHGLAVVGTFHFVCFTWIFFRAGSVANARDVLSRIGSLTPGFDNVSLPIAAVMLLGGGAILARQKWHSRAMEAFAAAPFYAHAAALVLVAIGLQLLGGHGSAPFVYSRF